VYVYAHCLRNNPGGVTFLVINADRQQVHEITLPSEAERYTLTAKQLQDTTVQLNGKTLELKEMETCHNSRVSQRAQVTSVSQRLVLHFWKSPTRTTAIATKPIDGDLTSGD